MEFKDLLDKLNKELVENISNIKDEEEKMMMKFRLIFMNFMVL